MRLVKYGVSFAALMLAGSAVAQPSSYVNGKFLNGFPLTSTDLNAFQSSLIGQINTANAGNVLKANNLSDLQSISAARTVLGLGALALQSSLTSSQVTGALGYMPLSSNQTITASSDCAGSGATSLALTCTKTGGVTFTSAATTAIGTSGSTIPLLSGVNTWGGSQTISGAITLPGGGGFWTNTTPGAITSRIRDRLFLGAATVESGDFYNCTAVSLPSCPFIGASTKDWLEQFEAARSDPRAFRTSQAQIAVGSTTGGIAIEGYVRTSDSTFNALQLGQALTGECVNDNSVLNNLSASCGYNVAFKTVATQGATQALELEAADEVGPNDAPSVSPQVLFPNGSIQPLLLGCGAADSKAVGNPCSYFLGMANSNAPARAGWVLQSGALTVDGSGFSHAAEWSNGMSLEWYGPNSSISNPTSRITSTTLTQANAQQINFGDSGVYIGSMDGTRAGLSIAYVGTAQTSNPTVSAGQSGGPAVFGATPLTSGQPASVTVSAPNGGTINLATSGTIQVNGTAAVSCAAGSVNPVTLTVTNGIVTHC